LARSVDPRFFGDFGDDVLPGLAGVAELDLTAAGSCANAVGIGCAGWATAPLSKQGRDAHPRKYPREGANQPKPIRTPASTPTKSSPIRFPSSGARLALVTRTNSALVIYLLRKSIKRPLSARRCPAHAWMGGLDRAPDPCRNDRADCHNVVVFLNSAEIATRGGRSPASDTRSAGRRRLRRSADDLSAKSLDQL